MAQLKCTKLCLGYEGKEILHNLNFEINQGDYLYIVGENGSGKTTLMKTILGLHEPMHGTVETGDGVSRSEIGYLPQQTPVQKDFPATVWEVVLSGFQGGLGLRPFYNKEEKEAAAKNLEKMGILNLKNECFRDLSGGQQQRTLLARALCATKKVLLLDEPVSGLDFKVTDEMYELIEELNKEGITIIMISHDIDAARKYASHILYVGDDTEFKTKDEYFKEGNLNA